MWSGDVTVLALAQRHSAHPPALIARRAITQPPPQNHQPSTSPTLSLHLTTQNTACRRYRTASLAAQAVVHAHSHVPLHPHSKHSVIINLRYARQQQHGLPSPVRYHEPPTHSHRLISHLHLARPMNASTTSLSPSPKHRPTHRAKYNASSTTRLARAHPRRCSPKMPLPKCLASPRGTCAL